MYLFVAMVFSLCPGQVSKDNETCKTETFCKVNTLRHGKYMVMYNSRGDVHFYTVHIYLYISIYIYISISIYLYIYVCVCVCVCVCVHACVRACMHACVCVCVYHRCLDE